MKYQVDLDDIQFQLNKRAKYNAKFGKSYILDKKAMTITKIKLNSHSQFEYECINYFCKYYRDVLNLNFFVYKQNDKLITVSPIVSVVNSNNKVERNLLMKNTSYLLDCFVKQNKILYNMLITPELKVKVYIDDQIDQNNFFIYNDQYYLLDLETFYFCIHVPTGESVGLAGVNEHYKGIIKEYIPSKDMVDGFFMDNMLTY